MCHKHNQVIWGLHIKTYCVTSTFGLCEIHAYCSSTTACSEVWMNHLVCETQECENQTMVVLITHIILWSVGSNTAGCYCSCIYLSLCCMVNLSIYLWCRNLIILSIIVCIVWNLIILSIVWNLIILSIHSMKFNFINHHSIHTMKWVLGKRDFPGEIPIR